MRLYPLINQIPPNHHFSLSFLETHKRKTKMRKNVQCAVQIRHNRAIDYSPLICKEKMKCEDEVEIFF